MSTRKLLMASLLAIALPSLAQSLTPMGAEKPNTDLAQACQLKLAEAF